MTLPAKYSEADRAQAHELFMRGTSIAEIARQTGIGHDRISKWASQGRNGVSWHTEREELIRSQLEDGFTRRKLTVARAAELPPKLLLKGLEALEARETPLSVQEMERVANVHTALDRIARLDSGKSTDNQAVNVKVKLSLEDIREILKADPLGE